MSGGRNAGGRCLTLGAGVMCMCCVTRRSMEWYCPTASFAGSGVRTSGTTKARSISGSWLFLNQTSNITLVRRRTTCQKKEKSQGQQ